MKKLTTGQIINLINQYTRKLHEQKHVSLTKNQLTTIIPLESHQAIALQVTEKGDGERSVDYFVLEHVYIEQGCITSDGLGGVDVVKELFDDINSLIENLHHYWERVEFAPNFYGVDGDNAKD